MIYTDLEQIYREQGIPNKYILTLIVSARARQLSDQKGRLIAEDGAEKYITRALREVQSGLLTYHFSDAVSRNPHVNVEK